MRSPCGNGDDKTFMKTEIDYISIAVLNQYNYCPHRCWRMFCAGEFVDNHYTIEGTSLHDRVHTVGDSHREETWQVRAIWLRRIKVEVHRGLGQKRRRHIARTSSRNRFNQKIKNITLLQIERRDDSE
jgi:CRISPR/Cas system-associated exonuclease Cas4 (RecB family)